MIRLLFVLQSTLIWAAQPPQMPAQSSMLLDRCGRYLLVGKLGQTNHLVIFPGTLSEASIELSQVSSQATHEYAGKWVKTLVDIRSVKPLRGQLALQDGITEDRATFEKDSVVQVVAHAKCEEVR